MTITIGTVNTGTHLHGTINAGAPEFDQVVQPYFGLTGEHHLLGKLHGRDLSCFLILYDFATHKLAHDGITALNALVLQNGTLRHAFGGVDTDWADCVFLGFIPEEDPWWDASGVNGWQVRGTMKFRQAAL